MFDVVIQGGTLIDGSGRPRRRADVAIAGAQIAAVGDLASSPARHRVDANGHVVAPGFIDVHTHSDGWMVKRAHQVAKTAQGFTTELLALDGIGYAPVDEYTAPHWLYYLQALDGLAPGDFRGWQTLAEFMAGLDAANVQNSATHIPYANVRSLACGFAPRRADDYQMRSIQLEVRRGMEAGAVGLSTGLDYIVQCYATTEELVEACRVVAEFDGLYATHVRYKKGLPAALAEAVDIARRSGVRLHISHLKAPLGDKAGRVLEFIDAAARDVELSFDVYPYQPGSTMLSYLLPYEVWDDGPLSALDKLADPAVRLRFARGLAANRVNLDGVRIAWTGGAENRWLMGQTLAEFVAGSGLPAADALIGLLIEERLAVLCVMEEGDDRLIEPFLKHPLYMMGSDGIDAGDGRVHPRQFGSAARLLGPCVRDRKLFTLEEGVQKLSGKPARWFRLSGRGEIREGHFADITVFDADTICDRATYDNPRQLATGVTHVFVNGTLVIEDATPAAAIPHPLPGRFLRRDVENAS